MKQSFNEIHGSISKHLGDMKKELGHEIKDMEYNIESVNLSTVPYKGEDRVTKYRLDSSGECNLKSKFSSLLESEDPHALVFGTCFSKKSEVNDYICAYGLYPALFLSADLGNVTDRKRFKLDEQQTNVINNFLKVMVPNVSVFLSTSHFSPG